MVSLAPDLAATSIRCDHSISIGGTATNSGPGKSPRDPIPDSEIASSAARSAKDSDSAAVQDCGGRKSMVPAMRVLRPSVAKRVMARMPDSPAVSLAQLSVLPAPSEVTTPSPVTTTIGRPILSLIDGMLVLPSIDPLDQRQGFAPPMADTSYQDLAQFAAHRTLYTGRVGRRKQTTMAKCNHGQCHIHGELRFQPVPDIGTGGTYGKVVMSGQECTFLGGDGRDASGAGNHSGIGRFHLVFDLIPQARQARGHGAGLALGAVG